MIQQFMSCHAAAVRPLSNHAPFMAAGISHEGVYAATRYDSLFDYPDGRACSTEARKDGDKIAGQ